MDDKSQNLKHFHSTHSPVDMTKPNLGNSNISKDWIRARAEDVTINGRALSEVIAPYVDETKQTVRIDDFFKEVILKDLVDKSHIDRDIAFLKKTFHQGGLLTAVSGAFASNTTLTDKRDGCGFMRRATIPTSQELQQLQRSQYIFVEDKQKPEVQYYNKEENRLIRVTRQTSGVESPIETALNEDILAGFNAKYPANVEKLTMAQLHDIFSFTKTAVHLKPIFLTLGDAVTRQREITTTPQGFTFKESFQVKNLVKCDDTGQMVSDKETMLPIYLKSKTVGNDNVVEGLGVLNVDFSQNRTDPTLTPVENMISYYHPEVKQKLDKRNFLQALLDFCRYYLGFNVAEMPKVAKAQSVFDDNSGHSVESIGHTSNESGSDEGSDHTLSPRSRS